MKPKNIIITATLLLAILALGSFTASAASAAPNAESNVQQNPFYFLLRLLSLLFHIKF